MPGLDATYHVELLGGFALTEHGQRLDIGPAGERVVALLAIRSKPLARHLVAGLLWPNCAEGRALANLRSTLHRLTPRSTGLLVSAQKHVGLDAAVSVDLRSAKVAGERILSGQAQSEDLSASVRELLSQDVLPGWHEEDWVLLEREAFRQMRLHALEAACQLLGDRGRYGDAIAAGLAAVSAEPLRESAHRALISAHLRESNYGEAIAQYEQCRTLLRDELGVAPSLCLRDLVQPRAENGRPRAATSTSCWSPPRVSADPGRGTCAATSPQRGCDAIATIPPRHLRGQERGTP
jgi:DNA-binding SARP family transcriptional activator